MLYSKQACKRNTDYNITMEEKTTNQVNNMNRNPTGKGGFGDNPQNRSDGRWSGEDSVPHQYNKLIRMKVGAFKRWLIEHPEDDRTVAEELAYNAVVKARTDLKYLVEVTDRTSGKSVQTMKHEGDLVTGVKVEIVDGTESKGDKSI